MKKGLLRNFEPKNIIEQWEYNNQFQTNLV